MQNGNALNMGSTTNRATEAEPRQESASPATAPIDLHETAIRFAVGLPDEQDAQRIRELIEEMRRPAASLCDVFLDLGNRADAEVVARIFHFPISAEPLTYGQVANAISAAKSSKEEMEDLALAGMILNFDESRGECDEWCKCDESRPDRTLSFFRNWPKELLSDPTMKLSVEDMYCHRLFLERIGLWGDPAAPVVFPWQLRWEWNSAEMEPLQSVNVARGRR
jgi:hypothetical protein